MADQRTIPEGKRNAFYRSPEIPEKEKNGNPRSTPKKRNPIMDNSPESFMASETKQDPNKWAPRFSFMDKNRQLVQVLATTCDAKLEPGERKAKAQYGSIFSYKKGYLLLRAIYPETKFNNSSSNLKIQSEKIKSCILPLEMAANWLRRPDEIANFIEKKAKEVVKEFNETFAFVDPEERETTDREFSISGNVPFYHSNSNHKEHGRYVFRISTYDFVYGRKSDKKIQLKDLKVLIKCCSTFRFFGFGEQHEGTQWRMDSIGFNYNLLGFLELLRSADFKKLMKEIQERLDESKPLTDESSEPPASSDKRTSRSGAAAKRPLKPVLRKPPAKSAPPPPPPKKRRNAEEQYFPNFQTSEDEQDQDEDDRLEEEEEELETIE